MSQTVAPVIRGRFFCDIVTLKVEDTLHRIPRFYLEEASHVFKDMFSLPQGPGVEGQTEENPIVLTGCTNIEFESLLEVVIHHGRHAGATLEKPQYISALRLATMWDMEEVRKEVIKTLSSLELTTAEKIAWGKRFRVSNWLVEGCVSVVSGSTQLDIDALAECIGWEATARVLHTLPRPQPSTIVNIDTSLFRCDLCGRRIRDPAGKHSAYCGRHVCTTCGSPQLSGDYPVRVNLADICPRPSDKNSVEIVRKILADELKDME